MSAVEDLILDVLFSLVESVADEPRRILFRGVSDMSDAFRVRVRRDDKRWKVMVTGIDPDVVGVRNDVTIPVLVVFYRDEVRERESLNAFRQFNEDAIVEALVRFTAQERAGANRLSEEERNQLRVLLDLTYPSVERLAAFLIEEKEQVGEVLPLLGLFADDSVRYGMNPRHWRSRLQENHLIAVMNWREFLEKGRRSRDARRLLGERLAMFEQAETDPASKEALLRQVSFAEAQQIFNPPTRLVAALMQAGLLRQRAEELVVEVKAGKVEPDKLIGDVPALLPAIQTSLQKLSPITRGDDQTEEEDGKEPGLSTHRVGFCLEALIQLAGPLRPEGGSESYTRRICLARDDVSGGPPSLTIECDESGAWRLTLTPDETQVMSVPKTGAADIQYRLFLPERPERVLMRFSLENLAGRLEPFREIWPETAFWDRAAALDVKHAPLWRRLQAVVDRMRDLIDPDWRHEQEEDTEAPDREPNNAVYLIFDLLYLAHREVFEEFLDAWIAVATLPWRATVAVAPDEWRTCIATVLNLGLAAQPHVGRSVAVLPFHPVRLAWHRAVFQQIERWLTEATRSDSPLVIEPAVLSEQLQAEDRPPVLFYEGERLVEASTAPFFNTFVSRDRQRRARAPLYRAQQKLEQFGRMWPFSLARMHLAFQPDDAGYHVYRLLSQYANTEEGAAFRVRAIVVVLEQPLGSTSRSWRLATRRPIC